jgi:superfamily I DNA/RNA helicase
MPTSSSNAFRIIQTKSRRVEVLASPGSGKTYTLVRRIQYLLASGVPARSILVLSFSNASVRELRRRMDLLCTEPRSGSRSTASKSDVNMSALTVQTAHACALALMRQRSTKPTILSDVQLKAAVKKALNNARRDCRQGLLWANVSLPEKKLRLQQLVELAQPLNIGLILRLLSVARAALKTVSETAGMTAFEDLISYVKLLLTVTCWHRRYPLSTLGPLTPRTPTFWLMNTKTAAPLKSICWLR